MFSYKVEIPPFGLKALGAELVEPIFRKARKQTLVYIDPSVDTLRFQPQLSSANSTDYDERFPVQHSAAAPAGASAIATQDVCAHCGSPKGGGKFCAKCGK
jgi:hypothetical protein